MSLRLSTLLLWLLWPSVSALGQKFKTNPFQQVQVPQSVLLRLQQVATKQSARLAAAYPLYVTNLLATQDVAYHEGLYYFRIMSPHAVGRLFIVHNGQATIFTSTDAHLIDEYADFLAKNELPEKTRIRYVSAIAAHLERQYTAEYE
jgi:hypothetical protein